METIAMREVMEKTLISRRREHDRSRKVKVGIEDGKRQQQGRCGVSRISVA
jgi:hypothetical protein